MVDRPRPSELPAPSRLPSQPELPDPFTRFDGTAVETPGEWPARRAELERLFRHYVYGYAPEPPELRSTVHADRDAFDGSATLREIELSFPELPSGAPAIRLALFLPRDREPVPVVLGLNRQGNHTVVDEPAVDITSTAEAHGTDERGGKADGWSVPYLLERGYGFATFCCADVDPDRDEFADGIHPHFEDDLPGPPGTEWGTIAAWAWGIQRCVDYLVDAEAVREDGILTIGKSRRGKATLLAGATDDRIGMVVPHQSGTGGVALSRDNGQETISRIATTFPHWFNDLFHGFGNREDRLPIDQHLLIAMVAPRPVLDTAGSRDYWANPGRSLDAITAAAPVWEFLGETGIVGDGLIYDGQPITAETVGNVCQFRRETGHVLDRGYWDAILDVADLRLLE